VPEPQPVPETKPEPAPEKVAPVKKPKKKKKKRVVAKKPTGFITVTTEPPADIFLGGKKLGRGSIERLKVTAGKHKLKVVARQGSQKTLTVKIKRGGHVEKNVTFGQGKLRVVVLPWANVWVDGKKLGQTPMPFIELMEGFHRVRLVNDQLGKDINKKVRILPGKESLLRLDLR